MAGTWTLLREIARKKLSWNTASTRPRVDRDLPLGIRIGSLLNITSVDAILAGDGLKFKVPTEDMTVIAFGIFDQKPFKGYRFYLSTDSDELFTLQIVLDKAGNIDDCKLFHMHDEFVPEEWGFWLDENDGYIGYSLFQLKDGTYYMRDWTNALEEKIVVQDGENTITHIPPVVTIESIIKDPYGEDCMTVKYEAMQYGRDVTDTIPEYMLASVAEDKDGATIQIMLGLDLTTSAIKVLF
jgi:hypothetical protein